MVRHVTRVVEFAVLLTRSFPLLISHCLVEVEKFNLQYPDPAKIVLTADKLRWYRYRKGLLQREVADAVGIDRSTYIYYEEVGRDYYPLDQLRKIAALLDVEVTDLMDEYNLFLYHDQGKQIREKREALGMSIVQYAKCLWIQPGKLRC